MFLWIQKCAGMSFQWQENLNRNLSQYFLLSRLPEVTVCSYSTSNDLYDVKSPLVQVTVVPAEISRRFGTKNLPLFGDEAPGTIETEALPDTDVEWFPGICNILLSLFAVLPKSGSK